MIALLPSREVAVSIGNFAIHWYGIMYALAFIVGWNIAQKLEVFSVLKLTKKQWSQVVNYVFLGVILGGRLGYMVLYAFSDWLADPLLVFRIWEGGMSSHGGFMGVIIALLLLHYCKRIPLLPLVDVLVVPIAIGLAFGRFGNFINQELYGPVTTLPWGMYFDGADGLRHPTQLYAIGNNVLIALACGMCLLRFGKRLPGVATATFLLGYAVLRFLVEFVRVPTHSSFTFGALELTRGQLYSIPIFLLGVGLLLWLTKRAQTSDGGTH